MGHKVNPISLRLGINRTWNSRWFAARQEYGKLLHEDLAIRDHVMQHQRTAGVSKYGVMNRAWRAFNSNGPAPLLRRTLGERNRGWRTEARWRAGIVKLLAE